MARELPKFRVFYQRAPCAHFDRLQCRLICRRIETEPDGLGTCEYIRALRLLESCSVTELAGDVLAWDVYFYLQPSPVRANGCQNLSE